MGLFTKKTEGSLMDVIRCDEKNYLIWKWSPAGVASRKENAIRYGSTLRVKDGEVAIFVYKSKDGSMQDFIEGPCDQTIKTANFPVLSGIVGAAFGGNSPFPAEIYFINLSGNIRIPYFVREFDVVDPRFADFAVPISCKGALIFNIVDYPKFIKLNRMIQFDLDELTEQISTIIKRYTKSVITNSPSLSNTPLIQIERNIDSINIQVFDQVKQALEDDFGINIKRVDIESINLNKVSDGYIQLHSVTAQIQQDIIKAQRDVNITNMSDMQMINATNLEESMRIQREETQRTQRLYTESNHLSAHQINVQGEVARTAAESLGQLGGSSGMNMGGDGGGGGFNPAAMMTGVMMGGAVGGQMTGMMNSAMQGINTPQPPAPPVGAIAEYFVAIEGQQKGPFTVAQIRQMITNGELTKDTNVWKQGMGNWTAAGTVPDIAALFTQTPPPLPTSPTGPPPISQN